MLIGEASSAITTSHLDGRPHQDVEPIFMTLGRG